MSITAHLSLLTLFAQLIFVSLCSSWLTSLSSNRQALSNWFCSSPFSASLLLCHSFPNFQWQIPSFFIILWLTSTLSPSWLENMDTYTLTYMHTQGQPTTTHTRTPARACVHFHIELTRFIVSHRKLNSIQVIEIWWVWRIFHCHYSQVHSDSEW